MNSFSPLAICVILYADQKQTPTRDKDRFREKRVKKAFISLHCRENTIVKFFFRRKEKERMVKIYNAENVIEAERIVSILKESGIPSYYHDSSSSVVAYGVSGFGLYGVDVYVDDSDRENAQIVLESAQEAMEEAEEDDASVQNS